MVTIWSVAGHVRGEVDQVGRIAKVTIRQDVAKGLSFSNSDDMVSHLINRYREYEDPRYIFNVIPAET